MSDTQTTEGENGAPDLQKFSHWYWYDGQPVLIQLREAYVGVTYPNDPVMTDEGAPVAVPFLKGVVHVRPDRSPGGHEDVMFILQTRDPNPANNAMAHIAIPRHMVAYITHIERQLVQAAG